MSVENNILIENIKIFRTLLTEGVGEGDIIDAIQNHEWVYIYYDGDDNTQMGYRTIRPYVLGTHNTSGKRVLRAWQDNPRNSFHFKNGKRGLYHDYWVDDEGQKPGWRLFRVDKISKVYPIGKKFHDSEGNVMIPPGYRADSDKNIDVTSGHFVSRLKQPEINYLPSKYQGTPDKTRYDLIQQKWNSIRNGDKNRRKITPNDVNKLRHIASNVYKKNRGSFYVVIDNKNNFQLMQIKDKEKQGIPDKAIVGTLTHLYDTMVNPVQSDKLYRDNLNQIKSKGLGTGEPLTMKENEQKNSTIPYKKTTFFK